MTDHAEPVVEATSTPPSLSLQAVEGPLELQPDWLALAEQAPWYPQWRQPDLQLFVERLLSGPDMVLDLFSGSQRLATAFLLDKVQNLAGCANLEIVGLQSSNSEQRQQVFEALVTAAQQRLPAHLKGIELGRHRSLDLPEQVYAELGCALYYTTYTLRHSQPEAVALRDSRIQPLQPRDFDSYYALLCESFAHNPETSLLPYADALKAYQQAGPGQRILMLKQQQQFAGFIVTLPSAVPGQCEVRTLGVVPAFRGLGLGKALLQHALAEESAAGAQSCELTVAVKNQKALGLYKGLGFEICDESECWIWQRKIAAA